METRIDEIAPDIYRLSTLVDEIGPPAGFTFNQFLVRDEQPFLFHTGMRALFPLVSEAVARIVPLADLRWISFAHIEADECGAMNQFLAAAPEAEVIHGGLAVHVVADRHGGPSAPADGRRRGRRPRHAPAAVPPTPHVPLLAPEYVLLQHARHPDRKIPPLAGRPHQLAAGQAAPDGLGHAARLPGRRRHHAARAARSCSTT